MSISTNLHCLKKYICSMIDLNQKTKELSYYCMRDSMGLLDLDQYAEVESIYNPNFYRWLFDDDTLPMGELPPNLAKEFNRFLEHLRLHPRPNIK